MSEVNSFELCSVFHMSVYMSKYIKNWIIVYWLFILFSIFSLQCVSNCFQSNYYQQMDCWKSFINVYIEKWFEQLYSFLIVHSFTNAQLKLLHNIYPIPRKQNDKSISFHSQYPKLDIIITQIWSWTLFII